MTTGPAVAAAVRLRPGFSLSLLVPLLLWTFKLFFIFPISLNVESRHERCRYQSPTILSDVYLD